jgi:hypothetical protein
MNFNNIPMVKTVCVNFIKIKGICNEEKKNDNMLIFNRNEENKKFEKIDVYKNTFKVLIDTPFAHLKKFCCAFWQIPEKDSKKFSLTNLNLDILDDIKKTQESNFDEEDKKRSSRVSSRKSNLSRKTSTNNAISRIQFSGLVNNRKESNNMSMVNRKIERSNLRWENTQNDNNRLSAMTHHMKTDSHYKSIFNNTKKLLNNDLENNVPKSQQGKLMLDLPFSQISEVNLIENQHIDTYRDLLSIGNKGDG